jgi:AcrR family transcriptional regulator
MAKKDESPVKTKLDQAERILAAAETVFFKFGIRKTTVGDICRAAGISRVTFYHYFCDKELAAEAVVNKLIDDMTAAFRRIMSQDVPYSQRIAEFIESKLNRAHGMSQSFVQELFQSPYPKLHELFRRRLQENRQLALDEFRKAQRQGHIRPDVKPEFLLAFLEIIADLSIDERLTSLYPAPKELGSELLNLFFFGILQAGRTP